jgi:hypothetical protein
MFRAIRHAAPAVAAAALIALAGLDSGAQALERNFRLVNKSGEVMVAAHITDIDRRGWGRDLLGGRRIAPGDQISIEPFRDRGYCRFNIRLVFLGGLEQIIRDVNLCEVDVLVTLGLQNGEWRHRTRE